MPLTPEVDAFRDAWITALESGEYKQTRYSLSDAEGFCCLGVACDVALKTGKINAQWIPPTSNTKHKNELKFSDTAEWALSVLPDSVQKLAGYNSGNPTVYATREQVEEFGLHASNSEGSGYFEIAALNDDYHLSFPQIARILRNVENN
jgi:hypothetical protein